jgi:4-diphosphocytidyl-2C-methyl-D-erythritol kinase
MEINTKSKFRRGQATLSENEINDLLNVVKESTEAVTEAVKEVPQAEEKSTPILQASIPTARRFYAIEKNRETNKYDVVEALEENGKLARNAVVFSHNTLEVAIAKLTETVSRLTLIKKQY